MQIKNYHKRDKTKKKNIKIFVLDGQGREELERMWQTA